MDTEEISELLKEGEKLEKRLIFIKKKLKLLALAMEVNIDLDQWEIISKREI